MTVAEKTSRKAKDSERTRRDILQAALEVFAERGFSSATVRDIASRIGMSHGMIRYHYETKEQLWFASVDYLFERLDRELAISAADAARLDAGELDIFRDWLRRYVRYCADHPEHARIMMQESVSPSARLDEVIEKHVRAGQLAALKTISVLQEHGVFPRDVPPASLIYMITGACQNVFALAPEVRRSLDYDALSDIAVEAHAGAVVSVFCPVK
ncbi:MAG: TetR/AcrR family transcriptional regulator [Pseudomonadota bacterium]